MIWKYGKKRPICHFQKEELEEETAYIPSPLRGWYSIYTFPVEEKIDPEELKWSLREEETLALVLFDIHSFSDRIFDGTALDNMRDILGFFAENNKDVILRPVYDRTGHGRENEPEQFSMVLQHLQQIGELLQKTEHSVFVFQGVLVGSWGEMHTSKYLSDMHLRRLWQCISPYLGEQICLAVRTPAQWRTIIDENAYKRACYPRICLFDDAIFASGTHLGTFGTMLRESAGWSQPWARQEELRFEQKISENMPAGGEALSGQNIKTQEIIRELEQMHVTYLNSVYDPKLLDTWKKQKMKTNGIWNNCSVYDYIGAHLGYRFVVRDVWIKRSASGMIQLKVQIENCGFASICQNTELILLVQSGSKTEEYGFGMDLMQCRAGGSISAGIRIKPVRGKVYLMARKKADQKKICFSNKGNGMVYLGAFI